MQSQRVSSSSSSSSSSFSLESISQFLGGKPSAPPPSAAEAKTISDIAKEREADKLWAKTMEARVILSAGSKTAFPNSGYNAQTIDEFIQARGFANAVRLGTGAAEAGSASESGSLYDTNPCAHRTLTAALTFPLTLVYGINKLFPPDHPHPPSASTSTSTSASTTSSAANEGKILKILIVGPRAEASLPGLWWREGLINLNSPAATLGLDIAMIGPGISTSTVAAEAAFKARKSSNKLAEAISTSMGIGSSSSSSSSSDVVVPKLHDKSTGPSASRSTGTSSGTASCASQLGRVNVANVTIPHPAASHTHTQTKAEGVHGAQRATVIRAEVYHIPNGHTLLHQHSDSQALLNNSDIFVLYHPGLGHRSLRAGWKPTMQLLLNTGKPILCTAHSLSDLQRDESMIQNVVLEMKYLSISKTSIDSDNISSGSKRGGNSKLQLQSLIPAQLNPFASTRRTYDKDEDEGARVVTTNQYMHAFRMKNMGE